MHGYSRLGYSRPGGSPPSSPRCRHGRNKNAGAGRGPKQSTVEKVVVLLISVVFKRRGVLLFAPLLYISGMLLYMGSVNFDVVSLKNAVVVVSKRSPPGSVYRSPQVFHRLWPRMQAESNHTHNLLIAVWNSKVRQVWKPCISNDTPEEGLPKSNGLFIIEANGGLNQQRLSICDAVAVAGLLNATLLIPIFHLNSVWKDSSHFGNIFDEDYFIHALRNHVNVVREVPGDILERFDNNISNIVNLRVKGWSSSAYYLQKVLPKLEQMGAVRIAPFSNRLAHGVPSKVQRLRCFANFEALRFSSAIRVLADKMVERMVKSSSHSGGKYVSVHLRFEEDMVAFSCCEYDGGEEEKHEMDIARERSWRGKFRRRGRVIRPGANRVDGKCPLTPLEVGMMLRGMGFDNTTSVYIAAGNIYKVEKYMAPLKQMFPRLEMKDTLATAEELAPFKGHLSRLAALDYTVCLHSEVFVTTQGGNFPHFLMGHRRYLYGGHSKTIKPDKRKLALLFDNPSIRWEDFKRQMQDMLRHSDQKGFELKKPSASLYTFPMPDCMCKEAEATNISDSDGNVPLWEAILNGHEQIAKLLLDNGADLNSGDIGQFACTAAEQNRLDLLKEIVRHGGDVTRPKSNGTTALHVAVSEDNVDIVKYLLDQGADVDKPDLHGWTPRALAEQQGPEDIKSLFHSSREPKVVITIPEHKSGIRFLGRFTSEPTIHPPPTDSSFSGVEGGSWSRNRPRRRTNNFHNSLFGMMSAAHTGEKDLFFSIAETKSPKNYASNPAARVTISCPEKGEVKGKLVLLPQSYEELLEIGAKKFGLSPAKIVSKDGAGIDDIDVIRDGDHLVFVSAGESQQEQEEPNS